MFEFIKRKKIRDLEFKYLTLRQELKKETYCGKNSDKVFYEFASFLDKVYFKKVNFFFCTDNNEEKYMVFVIIGKNNISYTAFNYYNRETKAYSDYYTFLKVEYEGYYEILVNLKKEFSL